MAIVVTRKHWIPLGVLCAIYFLWFNRLIGHSPVHPKSSLLRPLDTMFFWVVMLGIIGFAFFAPMVVVKRKHWVVFAVLLAMQIFGILVTVPRAGIHVPAFLWPFILIGTICYSFVTALLIVLIVGVVARKGNSHSVRHGLPLGRP